MPDIRKCERNVRKVHQINHMRRTEIIILMEVRECIIKLLEHTKTNFFN